MKGHVKNRPNILFILLENVKGMLHERKQFDSEVPMEIQSKQLAEYGFERVFSLLLNSSEFGLAQSRSRSWSLFVRSTNVRRGSDQTYCDQAQCPFDPRLSSLGERFMRTLCCPALPLRLFLNKSDELTKSKCGASRGSKWKEEYEKYAKCLGHDTCSFTAAVFLGELGTCCPDFLSYLSCQVSLCILDVTSFLGCRSEDPQGVGQSAQGPRGPH